MINISEIVATWQTDGDWHISPGVDWCHKGTRIIVKGNLARIGNRARIGDWAQIGDGARIGDGAHDAIDIGFADGYRKCIAEVKGVAYIGAGCRWFTLAEALRHWGPRNDRKMTMCLMQSAIAISQAKGWAHE